MYLYQKIHAVVQQAVETWALASGKTNPVAAQSARAPESAITPKSNAASPNGTGSGEDHASSASTYQTPPQKIIQPVQAIQVTPPGDWRHGDFSTPVAFSLAKQYRIAPALASQAIADLCAQHPDVASTETAGGYVNLRLNASAWPDVLRQILRQRRQFGHHTWGNGQRVMVEYVSANPTGPLHAAHARGAILGDVVANLLQAVGYDVTREYYINDAGQQILTLARTVQIHIRAQHDDVEAVIPDGLYPGAYASDIARTFRQIHGQAAYDAPLDQIGSFATGAMMQDIQEDLQAMGIAMDVLTSEKALQNAGRIQETIRNLQAKGYVYQGTLPRPLGQDDADWQPAELMLFRSTAFGDDQDRPLQRADGAWTYFAGDVAYHADKVARGYDHLINVWGADHASHVQRMKAAMQAVCGRALEIFLFQIVHFYHQGQLLKMSKRAGTFVTLRDILAMTDPDALRLMMVTKKADTHLDLSLDKMQEQTKDNPVFYVQYAHARCCSVLRAMRDLWGDAAVNPDALADADLAPLSDLEIVRVLADWPRHVHEAATEREPHRIATYLQKLAHVFHGMWQQGNADASLRFVQPQDRAASLTWGALVQCVAYVIDSGLALLGIVAKDELR